MQGGDEIVFEVFVLEDTVCLPVIDNVWPDQRIERRISPQSLLHLSPHFGVIQLALLL
jgi:hypothetical protein